MGKSFYFDLLICLFLQCCICYSWKNLDVLDLGSNLFDGPLPSSLCKLENLQYLLLSNNQLSGPIPDCFANMSKQLTVLDLRNNSFHGKIPTNFPRDNNLRNLGLNGNGLEGPLPKSLLNCKSLEVLDIGHNNIRDTFPMWLETLPELKVLILKRNQMHGTIGTPLKTSSFTKLRILDISFNHFNGTIPTQLIRNFQAMKKITATQKEAQYMGDRSYYEDSVTLVIKGLEVELKRVLTIFTTIDLSGNQFGGNIPDSIGELNSLVVLNFSFNQFNGSIPTTIGDLSELESLDLSWNKLVDRIPTALARLYFLSFLNLSQNQLVGRIPSGGQFNTYNVSSFGGNAGLCGFPLENCGESSEASAWINHQRDHADNMLSELTWESVAFGFGWGMILGLVAAGVAHYTQQPKWLHEIVEDICKRSKKTPRNGGLGWQRIRRN